MLDLSFYFNQKYFIPSTRLKYWDYSSTGWYFITICTFQKRYYFGNIVDGKMELSEIGKIAKKYWHEIPKHFQNTKLDEFVIMPNHLHEIIVIENKINKIINNVETRHGVSLQKNENNFNQFSKMVKNSISSIINQFKSSVKRYANKNQIPFHWQPRFYDHIIRNEKLLNKIRQYIKINPLKWEDDEENPKNKKNNL